MEERIESEHEDMPFIDRKDIDREIHDIPVKLAQDFVRVYGSQVGIGSTFWDISFNIGHPITENFKDIYIEQRVVVTMSWQTAKALARTLERSIRNHEEQYGEIRLPPLPEQSDNPSSE